MKICVYGASSDNIDKIYFDEVFKLGVEIAKSKHTLVFGGGTHGLMGAAAKGVQSENGNIIGVSPKFFDYDDILLKNCTEFIYTETMSQRKDILEEMSDAFIMVPGGIGTYDEFFEIVTLKQLSVYNKPIVIFNVNGYYNTLLKFMDETAQKGFMSKSCLNTYQIFDDAKSIIEYIESYNPKEHNLNGLKY